MRERKQQQQQQQADAAFRLVNGPQKEEKERDSGTELPAHVKSAKNIYIYLLF